MTSAHKMNRHCYVLRRGAVTVEFAITCGLAFFFFFAAFEFSRVAMIRATMDNAVYEAGRVGVLPGASAADVERKCREILSFCMIRNASVTVTPDPIVDNADTISVQIDLPLDRNMFAPGIFFAGKTLSRSMQMERETRKLSSF